MSADTNTYPKLHNAAWPGLVGKGDDGEPPIDLDTLLDLTASAEVDGVKFDGIDLFLLSPHVDIDSTLDQLQELADKVAQRGLVIGTLVAPVWPSAGGGSAMGSPEERRLFLKQIKKACRIAADLEGVGRQALRHGANRFGLRSRRLVSRSPSEPNHDRRDIWECV